MRGRRNHEAQAERGGDLYDAADLSAGTAGLHAADELARHAREVAQLASLRARRNDAPSCVSWRRVRGAIIPSQYRSIAVLSWLCDI